MTTELYHHGILGQKWGVRRFQNPDGTRTAAGKARYNTGESDSKRKGLTDKQKSTLKKVAIGVGVTAAAGLAVYGAYKYSEAVKTEAWNQTIHRGEAALKEANKDTQFWEEAAEKYAGMSKEQIKAGHDAINKMGIDSINDTAAYNSSSFRQARRTLKGEGRESLPELEARGGRTYSSTKSGEHATGRNAWEERLKKELTNKHYGYMEENFGSRKSKTIFAPKTQNDSSPKLTLNPDVKGSETSSKKAAETLNALKDRAANSTNASKKAADAWEEGERYTKSMLGRSDKRTMDILSNIDKYGKSAEKMYGVTAEEIHATKNADEVRKLLDKKGIK